MPCLLRGVRNSRFEEQGRLRGTRFESAKKVERNTVGGIFRPSSGKCEAVNSSLRRSCLPSQLLVRRGNIMKR